MSTPVLIRPQFREVSQPWRRLIQVCVEVNFGHIDGIEVNDGLPVRFARLVKTIVPGKPNGAAGAQHERSPIHTKWAEFIADAGARRQFRITRLDIDQGLPVKAEIEIPGGEFV